MKAFSVQTPQYEGPLDLLLSIVRRNALSIAELPLAPIAAQYLAYIEEAEALDVNLGMEWIDMAARLIHWKSSSLLPSDPALPDPAATIAQELSQEIQSFSDAQLSAARDFLLDRGEEFDRIWSIASQARSSEPALLEEASLWTVRTKAQVLKDLFGERRLASHTAYDVTQDATTLDEMLEWIRCRMAQLEPGSLVWADSWFAEMATVSRKIDLFSALLEAAMNSEVRLLDHPHEQTFWIASP